MNPVAKPNGGADGRDADAPRRDDRSPRSNSLTRWLPWAALGLYLYAYRLLAGFDPSADSRMEGAARFLYDSTASSPGIIFALSAFFLFSRRRKLGRLLGRETAPGWAAVALVPAALLFAWAYHVRLDYLLIPSLTLLLLGAALLAGGVPALRVVLFPALFLILALPLSTVLVNQVSYAMQVANGGVTEWILRAVGLPAVSVGDYIYYDQHVFQVIEACTGLRTVQTLFMASFVYVEIFRRRGPRAWVLVSSSPLIGLFVNEVRILSIVMNPYSEISSVHTLQGLITIAGGVLILAGLDGVLGSFMKTPARRAVGPAPGAAAAGPGAPERGWVALASLAAAFVVVSLAVPSWQAPDLAEPRLGRLSASHDGWNAISFLAVDHDFFGSTRFSQTMLREYEKGDDQVEVFMGADDGLQGSNRALSPKTIVPGGGWEILRQGEGGLPGGRWYVARSVREARLIFHRNYNMDSFALAFARSLVGLGRGPFRRPGRGIALRLSTVIHPGPDGIAEAEARLDRFLESFEEPLGVYTAPDPVRLARVPEMQRGDDTS